MKCERIRELLSAYADDELWESEKQMVEEHLRDCPDCRDELQQIEEMKKSLALLGSQSVPDSFDEDLMADIRAMEEQKASGTTVKRGGFMKKFTAVAAVCVVGLCSFLVYNNMEGAEKDLPLTATLQAGEEDLLLEGNENTLESLEESTVKDALIQEEKQEKFEWKKKGQEENQTGGNDAATPEATEAVKVESVQEEQGSAEADLPAGSAAAEEPKVMKAVQSPGPGEEKGEDGGDQAVESPQLKALEEDIMNYENTQDNQSATEMQMYWDLVYNKVKGSGQVVSCSYSQSQQLWIIRAKLTDQETEDYVEYYGKEGKVWKAE